MLLHRVTQHVKEQNWTATGIDFVIVVVGVFFGIQVANWNEARVERELVRGHLSELDTNVVFRMFRNDGAREQYLIGVSVFDRRRSRAVNAFRGTHA